MTWEQIIVGAVLMSIAPFYLYVVLHMGAYAVGKGWLRAHLDTFSPKTKEE